MPGTEQETSKYLRYKKEKQGSKQRRKRRKEREKVPKAMELGSREVGAGVKPGSRDETGSMRITNLSLG